MSMIGAGAALAANPDGVLDDSGPTDWRVPPRARGDIYNLISTVSAEDAFHPLSEGQCSLVRS